MRRRALSGLACGVAAMALPATVLGGSVDAALRARLAAAKQGESVAVIAAMADRVDPRNYRASDRRTRNPALVKALKQKAEATQGPIVGFLHSNLAEDVRSLWAVNAVAARVPASLVDVLARLPGVERVYADTLAAPPDTTITSSSPPEANLTLLRAPDAWALGATGGGTVIANMDTGVDVQHPDLAARWRGGANSWYDPHGQHATPYDASGHGTQTMGLAVGGDAGGTSIGVAPGATWIAVKLYDDAGQSSYSRIHQGFQWLLDPDGNPDTNDSPDVVGMSWGLVGTAGTCITEFAPDIALLKASGIAVAVSAGNDGPAAGTSLSPANNDGAFSVGSVDLSGIVSGFSARGPSACGGGIFPAVVAPGAAVNTADLSFGGLPFYTAVSGTSFAAPQVAGVMALLAGAFPNASIADLENAIAASAMDAGTAGPDNAYGAGIVDAAAAYALLASSQAPDTAPASADDGYAMKQGATLSVAAPGVLANDTDAERNALTASLVAAPANGTLALAANGSFTYKPATAFSGTDTFRYRAHDGTLYGNTATVSIRVDPNTAPVANNDAATAPARSGNRAYTPVAINVIANDTDADANLDPATVTITTAPSKGGTATPNANGTVAYTPKSGFKGTETFRYRVRDTIGAASNIATVTVTVQ